MEEVVLQEVQTLDNNSGGCDDSHPPERLALLSGLWIYQELSNLSRQMIFRYEEAIEYLAVHIGIDYFLKGYGSC